MKFYKLGVYEGTQTISETNEEFTIAITLKIQKNKEGMKYIQNMFNKQQSPIITILGSLERQRKKDMKDGKYQKPYYIEGELDKY